MSFPFQRGNIQKKHVSLWGIANFVSFFFHVFLGAKLNDKG